MAKDDDILWMVSYHVGTDTIMALPVWKHSKNLSASSRDFVDEEKARHLNATVPDYAHGLLDKQLASRWAAIAEQRKGRS